MKICIDHWDTCYHESGFYIEMPVVPRVGEELKIHKSLFGERFFNEEPFVSQPLDLIDDCITCTVAIVQYTVTSNGCEIEVCITFD